MNEQCPDCGKFVRWGVARCADCQYAREAAERKAEANRLALSEMRWCPWPSFGPCICGEVQEPQAPR